MDPNETLRRIRQLAMHHRAGGNRRDLQWVELFEALDGWMTRGGFPPDAWDGERHYYEQPTIASVMEEASSFPPGSLDHPQDWPAKLYGQQPESD